MLFSYVQACQNECTHAGNKELQKAATAFLDILLLQDKASPPPSSPFMEMKGKYLFGFCVLSLLPQTHSLFKWVLVFYVHICIYTFLSI